MRHPAALKFLTLLTSTTTTSAREDVRILKACGRSSHSSHFSRSREEPQTSPDQHRLPEVLTLLTKSSHETSVTVFSTCSSRAPQKQAPREKRVHRCLGPSLANDMIYFRIFPRKSIPGRTAVFRLGVPNKTGELLCECVQRVRCLA